MLNDNEIRTLGTRILSWPMDQAHLMNLRELLHNCTLDLGDDVEDAVPAGEASALDDVPSRAAAERALARIHVTPTLSVLEQLLGDNVTAMLVPKEVVQRCQPVMAMVRSAVKQQTKYKYGQRFVSQGPSLASVADDVLLAQPAAAGATPGSS